MVLSRERIAELHQIMVEMQYLAVNLNNEKNILYKKVNGEWVNALGYVQPNQ